jgi:hypothetical protein
VTRVLASIFALTLVFGCASEKPVDPVDKQDALNLEVKRSVPLTEPAKEPEAPQYTNDQLAATYTTVYTKEDLAAANAQGIDPTKDAPTLTLKKDGTFTMGSTGSDGTFGKGTYKIEGGEVVLSLVEEPGQPARQSPRIKVLEGGKVIQFTSGRDGRTIRLERD